MYQKAQIPQTFHKHGLKRWHKRRPEDDKESESKIEFLYIFYNDPSLVHLLFEYTICPPKRKFTWPPFGTLKEKDKSHADGANDIEALITLCSGIHRAQTF